MPRPPAPQAPQPETPGDDALVARGFWRSIAVIAFITLAIVLFKQFRTKPAQAPGSDAPASAPAAPPSLALAAPNSVPFRDVAASAHVDFIHDSGARGAKLLPECLGGGVAIADLDGDGRLDLVFTQGQPLEAAAAAEAAAADADAANTGGLRIYLNTTALGGAPGGAPGGALDFARLAGDDTLARGSYANGLAIGDVDGNGTPDIYIACVGHDRLLVNTAPRGSSPAFAERELPDEREWGTSAGMLDADADGDLDIVVANYVRWSPDIDRAVNFTLDGIGRAYGPPTGFAGTSLALLVNDGHGAFRDATADSGIAVKNPVTGAPYAKALGLVFVDADRDGRTDILVANDRTPKFMLRNLGPAADGTPRFADIAVAAGFAFDRDGSATGAMGIDVAWPRNDDTLAVAVGNFANEPTSLYLADPTRARGATPVLSDDALALGIGAPTRRFLTFGAVFADFDLDGNIDFAQANGHLEPDIARVQPSQTYAQRGQLFINRGRAGGDASTAPLFTEADPASTGDLAIPAVGRALAAGDLDNDGDPDLVLVDLAGHARVLLNEQRTANHWIAIAPDAPCAIGAEVEITATIRGTPVTQRRVVSPTRSYLSQCEPVARFGIGDATRIDRVVVRWSDGLTAERTAVDADRIERIERPRVVR